MREIPHPKHEQNTGPQTMTTNIHTTIHTTRTRSQVKTQEMKELGEGKEPE